MTYTLKIFNLSFPLNYDIIFKMSTVFSTINAPYKHPLEEDVLADCIKSSLFPEKFREHIFTFFTEVSISEIFRFMREHNITLEEIRKYYFNFIKTQYTNQKLEEALKIE